MAKNSSAVKINFTVAITGHRDLARIKSDSLRVKLLRIFAEIESITFEYVSRIEKTYEKKISFELVSGLAIGADILAHQALDIASSKAESDNPNVKTNWRQSAIIPYDLERYRETICDGIAGSKLKLAQSQFDNIFQSLDNHIILGEEKFDGAGNNSEYHKNRRLKTLGQLLVRRADILIAVWDGLPARGMGGTADVVQEARRVGLPIIWIEKDTSEVRSINPTDCLNISNVIEIATEKEYLKIGHLEAIKYAIRMAIPTDTDQAHHDAGVKEFKFANRWNGLLTYLGANELNRNEAAVSKTRVIFYEVFLFIMLLFRRFPSKKGGVSAPLRKWSIGLGGITTDYGKSEWDVVNAGKGIESSPTIKAVAKLREPFIKSDTNATRLGHVYRSSYVLIYSLAGLAVVFALAGLLWHDLKPLFVGVELFCIIILGAIFLFGRHREWHKRWINSRQISESLRGIRLLTYLGVTGRRPIKPDENWVVQIVNNYAAMPISASLKITNQYQKEAAQSIKNILTNQISYHKNNHHRMAQLHHVLEKWSEIFVLMAFAVGLLFLIYYFNANAVKSFFGVPVHSISAHDSHEVHMGGFKHWFFENINYIATFIGGVFPAIATIFVSIRFQGDFERFAERSEGTAKQLEEVVIRLDDFLSKDTKHVLSYETLLEIAYNAQEILEADLEDWRFVYASKPTPGL